MLYHDCQCPAQAHSSCKAKKTNAKVVNDARVEFGPVEPILPLSALADTNRL